MNQLFFTINSQTKSVPIENYHDALWEYSPLYRSDKNTANNLIDRSGCSDAFVELICHNRVTLEINYVDYNVKLLLCKIFRLCEQLEIASVNYVTADTDDKSNKIIWVSNSNFHQVFSFLEQRYNIEILIKKNNPCVGFVQWTSKIEHIIKNNNLPFIQEYFDLPSASSFMDFMIINFDNEYGKYFLNNTTKLTSLLSNVEFDFDAIFWNEFFHYAKNHQLNLISHHCTKLLCLLDCFQKSEQSNSQAYLEGPQAYLEGPQAYSISDFFIIFLSLSIDTLTFIKNKKIDIVIKYMEQHNLKFSASTLLDFTINVISARQVNMLQHICRIECNLFIAIVLLHSSNGINLNDLDKLFNYTDHYSSEIESIAFTDTKYIDMYKSLHHQCNFDVSKLILYCSNQKRDFFLQRVRFA